jgi:hypothetical protein
LKSDVLGAQETYESVIIYQIKNVRTKIIRAPGFRKRERCNGLGHACFFEIQRDWAITLNPNRPMGEKKNPLQRGIFNILKRKFLVKKFLPVN